MAPSERKVQTETALAFQRFGGHSHDGIDSTRIDFSQYTATELLPLVKKIKALLPSDEESGGGDGEEITVDDTSLTHIVAVPTNLVVSTGTYVGQSSFVKATWDDPTDTPANEAQSATAPYGTDELDDQDITFIEGSSQIQDDTDATDITFVESQYVDAVVEYEIAIKVNGEADTEYKVTRTRLKSHKFFPLDPGTEYIVQVRGVNNLNLKSDTVTSSPIIAKVDDIAPAVPGNPTVTMGYKIATFDWDPVTDLDVINNKGYYHVKRAKNAGFTDTVKEYDVSGTSISFVTGGAGGVTWYFKVRTHDSSGNYSAYTTTQSGVTLSVPGADLTDALLKDNNLSDVTNLATSFNNIKQAATTTYTGVVELATSAETATGTDTTRAVTPAGAAYAFQPIGVTTAHASSHAGAGSDPITSLGPYTALSTGTGTIPIIAKGFAAQTADLQQWRDSSASVLANITSGGNLQMHHNDARISLGAAGAAIQGSNSGGNLDFAVGSTAASALRFWSNAFGAVIATLNSTGKLYLGGTANPTNYLDVNGPAAIGYAGTAAPASGLIVSGKVGLGTSAPQTQLQLGPKVVDDSNYVYDANTLMAVHQTATSATVLNDPKTVLMLARQGTGAQAYGAAATFNLSRYENVGVNSRTRLDISLAHASFDSTSNIIMTMLSSGNVGIGTNNPQTKLHLLVPDDGGLRIQAGESGWGSARLEFYSDPIGADWRPGYIASADAGNYAGRLNFYTSGIGIGQKMDSVLGMTIANGLVGIANGSPARKLHVGSAALNVNSDANSDIISSTGITIAGTYKLSLDNGYGVHSNIWYAYDSSEYAMKIQGYYGIQFLTRSATNAGVIRGDTGYWGIGTTAPTAKLTVQGTASENLQEWNALYGLRRMSVAQWGQLTGYLSDGLSTAWTLNNDDNATQRLAIGAHTTGTIPLYIWGSYAGQVANLTEWHSSNSSTLLAAVGPTGNFGIGASPNASWKVYASTTTGTAFRANADATGLIFSGSGNGIFSIDAPGVGGGRFLITDAGNVGIGTTAPAAKLHVVGNIYQAVTSANVLHQLVTGGGVTYTWATGVGGSNGLNLVNDAGGPTNLSFSNVNVGIGTTAPSAKLDVLKSITTNVVNNLAQFGYGGDVTNRSINIQQIGNVSTTNQFILLNGSLGSSSVTGTPTFTSAYARTWGLESTDTNLNVVTAPAGTNQAVSRPLSISSGEIAISLPVNMGSTTGLNGYKITNLRNAESVYDAVNYGQLQGTTNIINDGKTPAAPGTMTAYAATKSIVVTWPDVTTNVDTSASTDMGAGKGRYRVEISLTGGGGFSAVETKYTPALHATFNGLSSGVNYYFRVAAIDAFGNQSAYSAILGPVIPATVAIGDLAYQTITAEVITGDTIAFGQIVGGGIAADAIEVLRVKVGQNMQSTTFTANEGWKIEGDGHAYFRKDVTVGDAAGVTVIDNGRITLNQSGGANLVPNSSLDIAGSVAGTAAGFAQYNNAGSAATWSLDTGRIDGKSQKIDFSGVANTGSKGIYWNNSSGLTRPLWEPLKTYVFSYWAKASGAAVGGYVNPAWNVAPATTTTLSAPTLTTSWQRYIYRITMGAAVESNGGFYIGYYANTTGIIWIDDVQIEEGTQVTAYIGGNRDLYMREDFFLRSGNYVANSTGFSVMGDGSAEFNNLNLRGTAKSSGWNGHATTPDGTATAGWFIGQGGAAEFAQNLFIGGTATVKGNIVVGSGGAGLIKSQNHSYGGTGWILNQDGSAEFNASLFVSGATTIKGNVTVGSSSLGFLKSSTYSGTTVPTGIATAGWMLWNNGEAEFAGNTWIKGNLVVGGSSNNQGLIKSHGYSAGVSGWQVNYDGTAEFRNITARGDIQASSVTAGSVTAAGIAAGTITADKLSVGTMGTNLVGNPSFEIGLEGWAVTQSSPSWSRSSTQHIHGDWALALATGGTSGGVGCLAVPVVPGRTYTFRMKVLWTGTVGTAGAYIYSQWQNTYPSATGGYVTSASRNAVTPHYNPISPSGWTSWTTLEIVATPPAGNYWWSPLLYLENGTGSGVLYFDEIEFREQLVGTNIADGVITTDKLVANAVTAEKMSSLAFESGKYMQSTTWSTQASGWRINADGTAEFNNALFIAGATTIKGNVTVGSSNLGFLKSYNYVGTTAPTGIADLGWMLWNDGTAEFADNVYIKGNVILGSATNPNGLIKSYGYTGTSTVKGWQIDYQGNATFTGGALTINDATGKTWITGGGVAANAITATEISAGAITAEKLTVAAYGDSAIVNGNFEDASAADATMAAGWQAGGWGGGMSGTAALATDYIISGSKSMKLVGLTPNIRNTGMIPVVAGDVWFLSAMVRNTATMSGGVYIRLVNQDGAEIYNGGLENLPLATTNNTRLEGVFTIPSGTTSVYVNILYYGPGNGSVSTTGFYVDDVLFRKTTGAVQIQDGAITASKLTTTLALVGQIQSSSPAYAQGSAGWQIKYDGTAEFNNATVRGDITANGFFGASKNVAIPNGYFETDATGWTVSGTGATFARSNTYAKTGTWSGLLTCTTNPGTVTSDYISITEFTTLALDFWARGSNVTGIFQAFVDFYDVSSTLLLTKEMTMTGGTLLSGSAFENFGSLSATATAGLAGKSATAPSGTTKYKIRFVRSGGSSGMNVFLDDIKTVYLPSASNFSLNGTAKKSAGYSDTTEIPGGVVFIKQVTTDQVTSGGNDLDFCSQASVKLQSGRTYKFTFHTRSLTPSTNVSKTFRLYIMVNGTTISYIDHDTVDVLSRPTDFFGFYTPAANETVTCNMRITRITGTSGVGTLTATSANPTFLMCEDIGYVAVT